MTEGALKAACRFSEIYYLGSLFTSVPLRSKLRAPAES